MLKVITMVGTSIFTNYMKKEVIESFEEENEKEYQAIDRPFKKLENVEAGKSEEYKSYIGQIERIIPKYWLEGWKKEGKEYKWEGKDYYNNDASAEIRSILKIQKELKKDLDIYLLATDTILSRLAAKLIQKRLDNYKSSDNGLRIKAFFNEENDVVKGLQVVDRTKFIKEGLVGLINKVYRITEDFSQPSILNITGGYKAIIPYLTILGQVNEVLTYYIFEDTEELIRIPQAPLGVNLEIFERYWEKFNLLEQEKVAEENRLDFSFKEEASTTLEISDNLAALNPLGLMLWKKYKSMYVFCYASDDVWKEIQGQRNIYRILKDSFWDAQRRDSKTETKGEHLVYDDGRNQNRIYYFERDGNIYIYKTFQSHDDAERYIKESVNKEEIIGKSKVRKIKKEEVR